MKKLMTRISTRFRPEPADPAPAPQPRMRWY
jgi:hypothetical protein